MSIGSIIVLAGIAVVITYAIVIYNGLVALKHSVSKSLANIDVLLKQRHDELPKLVETCKKYMQYEQQTLERIISARSRVAQAQQSGDIGALGSAEGELRAGLGHLFALAENYPDLKTNDTFRQLQDRITGLENAIADRREIYNESVNNNNVRIEQFPDAILARRFSFKPFQLLQFSSEEKKDVDIAALFK
ncbi:MAG TPA: LemA family protein [Spongiibacteraceae bacterium]|nr:LemA family protein [Spongiibacteraceae bacterium]